MSCSPDPRLLPLRRRPTHWRCAPLVLVCALLLSSGGTAWATGDLSLFSNGFESGSACRWTETTHPRDCPPTSPRIVLVTASQVDELRVAWLPSEDDNTPSGQLVYELHGSKAPEFIPSDSTVLATTGALRVFFSDRASRSVPGSGALTEARCSEF